MKDLVRLLKVLADKNRLKILKLLEDGELCVCELAYILGITQPSVSRHLKKLKSVGLIKDRQEGLWTNYLLNKNDGAYAKVLGGHMRNWLNDDPLILSGRHKAGKADRARLCYRK
ncbi:MAG TPA: transcriptional regulator [Candidatus Omnitrophica bacterium]|nr:transcriptional regulator [Candidatus Omnitrophota bacterium]